jgi:hypothetical protein
MKAHVVLQYFKCPGLDIYRNWKGGRMGYDHWHSVHPPSVVTVSEPYSCEATIRSVSLVQPFVRNVVITTLAPTIGVALCRWSCFSARFETL